MRAGAGNGEMKQAAGAGMQGDRGAAVPDGSPGMGGIEVGDIDFGGAAGAGEGDFHAMAHQPGGRIAGKESQDAVLPGRLDPRAADAADADGADSRGARAVIDGDGV